ncbi:MAG: hypothetical protein M3Q79_01385 [bacterium]|nr:hypothetical protein [bacterium]
MGEHMIGDDIILGGTPKEVDTFINELDIDRGEQPDGQAMPADGALRGDVPHSNPDKENK